MMEHFFWAGWPRAVGERAMAGGRNASWVWLAAAMVSMLGSTSGDASDEPAQWRERGFAYRHIEIPDKPWSIHIVRIDRSHPEFELHTTSPHRARLGLSLLEDQIRMLPSALGRPIAGINGDYYHDKSPYKGDPKGLQILRGELVSAPSTWTCFWVDVAGNPQMTNVLSRLEVTWPDGEKTAVGLNEYRPSAAAVLYTSFVGPSTLTRGGRELVLERADSNPWLPLEAGKHYRARVKQVRSSGDTPLDRELMVLSLGRRAASLAPEVRPGSVLEISTATWPDLNGVKTAIGGGPALVRGGTVVEGTEGSVRHPRSAIGWNRDDFFFVEVDGRQRRLSVGMTDLELAHCMISIGCEEAMSLDGGGSAVCWVYGQIMNNPSEGRPRAGANGLVLVQKVKK